MPHADPTFTILALGAFVPFSAAGYSARLVPAEAPSLEDAMTALGPRLWIPVPAAICPEGGLTLAPRCMEDLLPEGLIRKTPYLKSLQDAGAWIENAAAGGIPPATIAAQVRSNWPTLSLDLSLPADSAGVPAPSAVDDLLAMVAMPGRSDNAGTGSGGPPSPPAWKIQLDGLLAANLSSIFADQDFRSFEAAWRGAEIAVGQGVARAGRGTRIYLVPVAPQGLEDAFAALAEKLSAVLPNLIVIDAPFDQSPRSIELLNRVAEFAGNLLAPAAVWIAPAFLHLHGWDELHRLPLLKNHIGDAAYAKWRKLMARPEGRWLAATGNRFLTRPPYGSDSHAGFPFFEEREPLWISPVWALATLAARSMGACGWPSCFADAARMQRVTVHDLPGRGRSVTEGDISEERMAQMIDIGLMMLAGSPEEETVFIPRETTVAGESLGFQLFFSRLIAFLIRCRETFPAGPEDLSPEAYVYGALTALFHSTGHSPPDDLSVTAAAAAGEPVSLAIAFTPPPALRAGNRQLAFTFSW